MAARSEVEQAAYVAGAVLEAREAGVALKSQAVLFRTSHHSGHLEIELARRNIPFVKFGGLKFLDATFVKDVLATLRFAQNPGDRVAGFRVLQLLPGVGPATAEAIMVGMRESLDPVLGLQAAKVPKRAAAEWPCFVALYTGLRQGKAGWPAELGAVRLWYEPQLERLHEDAAMRRADLVQLEAMAQGFGSREAFLSELTLDPPDATSDRAGVPMRDEDYLILSTIHSAKGLEWTQVFVLNCVDGCIPSDMATGSRAEIEEERRLLYVAMTRAKDRLHLITPQRFYGHGQPARGDRHVYAARSRFIPDAALDRFEVVSWPKAVADPSVSAGTARTDLRARMRGMWA